MKNYILLFIIIFILFSFNIFAETIYLKNVRTGLVYDNVDTAVLESQKDDTFLIGIMDSDSKFVEQSNEQFILDYCGYSSNQEAEKTYKNFGNYLVFDKLIFDKTEKLLKFIYEWYFKSSNKNTPMLDYIKVYGVRK